MNRLHLRDSITIKSSRPEGPARPEDVTVPAHVYTLTGANPREPGRPFLMVSALRAIVGPLPRELEPAYDRVEHHGTEYRIDGPALGRYRRGRLHHWTINLAGVTG